MFIAHVTALGMQFHYSDVCLCKPPWPHSAIKSSYPEQYVRSIGFLKTNVGFLFFMPKRFPPTQAVTTFIFRRLRFVAARTSTAISTQNSTCYHNRCCVWLFHETPSSPVFWGVFDLNTQSAISKHTGNDNTQRRGRVLFSSRDFTQNTSNTARNILQP